MFYAGSAVGFKLDSLPKLYDTRSINSKMTLMHYLCKVCFLNFFGYAMKLMFCGSMVYSILGELVIYKKENSCSKLRATGCILFWIKS